MPPSLTPTPPLFLSFRDLEGGSAEYEAVRKEVNLRTAKRLLHVCSTHGGVYTKFGQHISSLNHVLPKEFTETLKVLQDRNPRYGTVGVSRDGDEGETGDIHGCFFFFLSFCSLTGRGERGAGCVTVFAAFRVRYTGVVYPATFCVEGQPPKLLSAGGRRDNVDSL